jgi:hypothetical protein
VASTGDAAELVTGTRSLAEAIASIVRTDGYREFIGANPLSVHEVGLGYLAATAAGLPTGQARLAIERTVEDGALFSVEHKPTDQLAILHFLEHVGYPLVDLGGASWAAAAATLLARSTDPMGISISGAYAIAHAALFLTDFGARRAGGPDRLYERSVTTTGRLIARFEATDAADLDLELELAAAHIALAGLQDEASNRVARRALRRQRPDGSVATIAADDQAPHYSERSYWLQHYHRAVTAALPSCVAARWPAKSARGPRARRNPEGR